MGWCPVSLHQHLERLSFDGHQDSHDNVLNIPGNNQTQGQRAGCTQWRNIRRSGLLTQDLRPNSTIYQLRELYPSLSVVV